MIGFPRQHFDPETGLHPNWHRDYDSVLGPHIQCDPIGLGGGMSTFGHPLQNPIRFTDPAGLAVEMGWFVPFLADARPTGCGVSV